MNGLNQYSEGVSMQAQQEIQIMYCVMHAPKTPKEICAALGISTNRVAYLLRGLRAADCVRKIPGSHAVELVPF